MLNSKVIFCVSVLLAYLPFCILAKYGSLLVIILDNTPLSILKDHPSVGNITDEKTLFDQIEVHLSSQQYHGLHAWTYLPVIMGLKRKPSTWFLFLEEVSMVDYLELSKFVMDKNPEEAQFYGAKLQDNTPTIRHHFDGVNSNSYLAYPDIRCGFLLSKAAINRIANGWRENGKLSDFSIDAAYEFTKLAARHDIPFEHSENFCQKQHAGCISWVDSSQQCQQEFELSLVEVHFAVKTCSDLISDRFSVLEKTWYPLVENVALYSDTNDPKFGTISLGVPNTKSGHCGKTLAIIRHVAENLPNTKWLAIVDDDTLISPNRLVSFLKCFPPSGLWAIGERYGFRVTGDYGFDYITGGGGMVFSYPLVKKLAEPNICTCPSNESPDDMFLGSCLKRLDIPIVHSSKFHQARPEDYPQSVLEGSLPISFHKFWMTKPLEIYEKWLKDGPIHEEL